MAQAKATYEAVSSAIEQLKAEGRSVTIAAIQAITGGSNSTITLLKRQYEAERPTVLAARSINLNPEITHLIVSEITRTAHEAAAEATQRLAELEIDMTRVSEEAVATAAALESREAELDVAKGQIQSLAGQIEQLRADAEQVKATAAEQIRITEERAGAAVAKAEDEADRARKGREGTIAALGEANARLEALPRMEAEITRLQAALDTERTARTDAERSVAASDAKADGLAARLEDTQEQLRQAQAQVKEARDAMARTSEQLSTAQAARADDVSKAATRIGALEGTVAALEKQLTAAKNGKKASS